MNKSGKLAGIIFIIIALFFAIANIFYVKFLPKLIDINNRIPQIEQLFQEKTGYEFKFLNPEIKTYSDFTIAFSAENISVYNKKNNNSTILFINKPYLKIQPVKLIFKEFKIYEIKGENFFADISPDILSSLKTILSNSNSIKVDISKANIKIDNYEFSIFDLKINKKLFLKGDTFILNPLKNKLSKLTTSGTLGIEKQLSLFSLNIIGKFLFDNKVDIKNYSLNGYIQNINLEVLSPYLDKYTKYKNAKGLININFVSEIKNKKEILSEITSTIQNLSINSNNRSKQILMNGLNEIRIKTDLKNKKIKIEELKVSGPDINIYGNGIITNFSKNTPDLNLNIIINKSSAFDIVNLLPYGICKEIDIIKEKGFYGKANAALKIIGRIPKIKIYGNAEINNAQAVTNIKDTHCGNIKLNFKDTTMFITVDLKTDKGETFFLNGRGNLYDEDWSIFDINTSENLDLKLVSEILTPVSRIFAFDIGPVPLFKIKSGTGNAKLHIKGTKKIAFIDGFVRIKNACGSFDGIKANLSNVNLLLDFKGENIYFNTQKSFADNNPIHIFGVGSTTGNIKINAVSEHFSGTSLRKIIKESSFLYEAENACQIIEKLSGMVKFNVLLQGKLNTNIPTEQLIQEAKKLKTNGSLIFSNNLIKIKGFEMPVTLLDGKLNFSEKSADANNIKVKYGKNSQVTASFNGEFPADKKSFIGNLKITGSSLFISDSINFVLNSDFAKERKLKSFMNFDIFGKHSLSLSAKIKDNTPDIKSINALIKLENSIVKNSTISFPSGEIVLNNNCLTIKNFRILSEQSLLILAGQISNITSIKPYYNFKINGNKISVKSITELSEFIPEKFKKIITSCQEFKGTVNTNLNISNKGFSGFLNFYDFGFRHTNSTIPVYFSELPIKFSENKIIFGKITGEIGNTGRFPIFTDIIIENYMKIPIIKGTVSLKPTTAFIEKYINTKLSHPIKLSGDVNINADINGSLDSLKITPVLKINKDADISYLTVNFGNTDILREIKSEIFVKPKNIIIKNLNYTQYKILSDGKKQITPIWTATAHFNKKNRIYSPSYISLKTFQERPAKILNFLFKKSIIKSGKINCDIVYKNDGKLPKILGTANILNTDIPSYNIKIKEGIISANDTLIKIISNGSFLDTNFIIDTAIKNSITLPLNVKNFTLQTKKMNLERLIDTLNHWSIEAYSETSIKNDMKFNIADIIIEKGILKVEHIDFKTCPIEDLKADFTLDKNADLKINAENFKVADGIAENKITYNFKNGKTECLFKAKEIDSDRAASAFLGLQNQITGKADVKVSFNTLGLNNIERFKNIKGIIYFSVKNGNMPKLGSLEYLIRASNIIYSGLTTLSVNNIIELLKPFKQGSFSTITGVFSVNKGLVENLRIYSQGINMSLFINGSYNIEDSDADINVYGKLGKKIENLFGPLGNLSANTIFNLIPRDKDASIYDKELKKIPDIEYQNQDVKYFRATVNGNINKNDSASSFKWLK